MRRRCAGLTLTEVLVASTLLIAAMVPILTALTRAHANSVIVEHKTKTLTLAQAKLDEIKARAIYNYSDSLRENNLSLDGSYLCNVTDTAIDANLRQITVSAGYDLSGNGNLASDEVLVTLETLIAKRI